jgi:histidine triad (HIT) family protein
MPSIFSKIVSGQIPSYKILENDTFLAFLDVFPLTKGHTLVIPKVEIDYIFDMDDQLLGDMMIFAKTVAKAVGTAIPCTRVGVSVIGLEVPHAHIHLIPMTKVSDMNFGTTKLSFSTEEMEATANEIRAAL